MKIQVTTVAVLLFLPNSYGQRSIFSGTGFGTYYYDVHHVEVCGTSFVEQNKGPVECDSQTALSLDHINSNYVVAMNHTQLTSDTAKYCGKRVIVSVNGKQSELPLFIGDGCMRYASGSASMDAWSPNGAPGLDFSYSVLNELSRGNACADGYVLISWEIVEDSIYNFGTNVIGRSHGPISLVSTNIAQPTSSTDTAPATCTSFAADLLPMAVSNNLAHIKPVVSSAPLTGTRATNDSFSCPCSTGAWQCSGNILEQCITGSWIPLVTCEARMTCHGGNHPYCTSVGFDTPPTPTQRACEWL